MAWSDTTSDKDRLLDGLNLSDEKRREEANALIAFAQGIIQRIEYT
jgi:hypothetical protein